MSDTAASDVLPDGLLVSFYGDDFTGSTSVMEALTFAGLPTVLFLDTPTAAQRARVCRIPRHWDCRHCPIAVARLDGGASTAGL